jgi:peptidoglycan/xylan/chitin deacetylase (PgdA/CDA1 family)
MNGAWIGMAGAGLASAGALAYAVRGRSAGWLDGSVYRGGAGRARLALTFDDGPSPSTPALLAILAEHGTPATFFMCGRNVRRHADIARQVRAAGHEIGNHTDSHPHLHFKSAEFIYRELALAQETIQSAVGAAPVWFRAPYGVRWFGLRAALRRLNLKSVMWTVMPEDWKWPAARIAARLIGRVSNGAIVCLHDGRELQPAPDIQATLAALRQALPLLKERGFEFVTLSEILCPTN